MKILCSDVLVHDGLQGAVSLQLLQSSVDGILQGRALGADLMLDTTFETAEALKGYSTHPAHVAVANSKVRPYYKNRVCLDYEV